MNDHLDSQSDAASTAGTEPSEQLSRATALFEYLARLQQLKLTKVRHVDTYRQHGLVQWLRELPSHPAISLGDEEHGADLSVESPILTINRIPKSAPPEPGPRLKDWVDGNFEGADDQPRLKASLVDKSERDDEGEPLARRIGDVPGLEEEGASWLRSWGAWAAQEAIDRPARDRYVELYEAFVAAETHSEELELVVGVGLLGWRAEDTTSISRHLFTAAIAIRFDEDNGTLSVELEDAGFDLETDMMDPGQITHAATVSAVREDAAETICHPLDQDVTAGLARRVVHALSPEGRLEQEDRKVGSPAEPTVSLMPAIILRRRTNRGLVDIFNTIVDQLKQAGEVPEGLLPLVDPDRVAQVAAATDAGAMLDVDGDPFLPLPVNDRQLDVVRRVDSSAQVLVQGPPGTGKTHTAAALLSHLLAQGKRVLVTAHTDRALHEVRGKLPRAIQPLSVSVVGSSQTEMSELKMAVERISQEATDFEHSSSVAAEAEIRTRVDALRRRRSELFSALIEAREKETTRHDRAEASGTLAEIAQRYEKDAETYRWISGFLHQSMDQESPLSNAEMLRLHGLLLDERLHQDEPDSRKHFPALETLPDVHDFARACDDERRAVADLRSKGDLVEHEHLDAIRGLAADERARVQSQLVSIAHEADDLERRRETWMNEALVDVRSGRGAIWGHRFDQLADLLAQIEDPLARIGSLRRVELGEQERGPLSAMARSLRSHVATGKSIKVTADGNPRLGAFTPSVVKQSAALFETVRVDGLPPTTVEALEIVELAIHVEDLLDAMDRAWPATVTIPAEDTYDERFQWHRTEVSLLGRVLRLADVLTEQRTFHADLGIPSPDWSDLRAVVTFAALADVAVLKEAEERSVRVLEDLRGGLAASAASSGTDQSVARLAEAVGRRDTGLYESAIDRISRLHAVAALVVERDGLLSKISAIAPTLSAELLHDPSQEAWHERLATFEDAWLWARTGAWIREQESADVNVLQAQLSDVERSLHVCAEQLAAVLAWRHAVRPERMSGRTRADLTNYSQLVRKLGKGTGKYAAQQRAQIRIAMDQCREAVPVWIMPLFRVAEQLTIEQDMFDVVVIDEASQAGLEATFLQYIAPRIVVIGDDKQVSPSAVGIDQTEIRDLARQFISHERYREQWINPQRSYFDEAVMRFPRRIVLTEHRRCMPEIIGFSNRVAYEPEGVRLVPVRQFGADRLDPVLPVHVPDGYVTGQVNLPEAEAIADQIEKCVTDPAYDGKTIGVVSLLGGAQAKQIDRLLLERLGPDEIAAREVRCGDATDFQGSERDIMFLSMVSAAEPGKRISALTATNAVQRFNVAASRAKDQMWVFHSMTPAELSGRPDDMRTALLEYCYGVSSRTNGTETLTALQVSDEVPHEQFDSLFEQRIYNRILDRGFTVLTQVESLGYKIDLVVVGANGRLAVECDGDHWHGPAEYEKDLRRQRELERCGWKFVRIRESVFYLDRASALEPLWARLDELGIRPAGWVEPAADAPDAEVVPEYTVLLQGVDDPPDSLGIAPLSSAEVDSVHVDPETPAKLRDIRTDLPEPSAPSIPSGDGLEPALDAIRQSHVPVTEADVASSDGPPNLELSALAPYTSFDGEVAPIGVATRDEVLEGLVSIVTSEGPIVGERLHRQYVRSSGGQRVGKTIGQQLNRAISAAVRRKLLVDDAPLGEKGIRPRTFRLPSQPPVRQRELGPRELDHVPPRELAALLEPLLKLGHSREQLFREALAQLGLKRLTPAVESRLEAALHLAEKN